MVAFLGFWILAGAALVLAVSRDWVGPHAVELGVVWLIGLTAFLVLVLRRDRRRGRAAPERPAASFPRLSVYRLPRRSALWVARQARRRGSRGLSWPHEREGGSR